MASAGSEIGLGAALPSGIVELLAERFPDARLVAARRLGPDDHAVAATGKAAGYGHPIALTLVDRAGAEIRIVFHTASADEFGHDRRADHADEALLAFDRFGRIPRHVRALDVGAVRRDGRLVSLADTGEFYLVTEWAPGTVYADDLRRIADAGATSLDDERAAALARYLVRLHGERLADARLYTRALRDLVGHGEGIFGVVDGYPEGTPGAPPSRLEAIERAALAWRWRLKRHAGRLRRTHGDFHPFNVVFQGGTQFLLLDASRGCAGDPVDDLAAMSVNYPFFAVARPGAWARGLGALWRRFWDTYLGLTRDVEALDVIAPFWAWRTLVVCNPRFYPSLPVEARDRLLELAERALAADRFDLSAVEEVAR